jgi:signal transduction histidine kinase
VNNVLDGMSSGGDLHITCDASVESLVIEVKDTGEGLTEDQVQRLLNNGSIETNTGKCSISVGQRIAEDHGGSILVNSKTGQGTSYMMILPRDYLSGIRSQELEYVHQKTA